MPNFPRTTSLLLPLALLACSPGADPAEAPANQATQAPTAAPAATPVTPAAPPVADAITSRYTPIDLDKCTVLSGMVEGESVEWRCPGLGDIPLFVLAGDGRYDVDAGTRNDAFESASPFNDPPETVEWRVRDGAPFALIYRIRSATPEAPGQSWLMVETIGAAGKPGCRIATVSGETPDANVRAREIADIKAGSFRCGTDEEQQVGRQA